jgi:hypothetical protein
MSVGGGGKGGSQPSGFTNVTQTQNTQPWAPQQPYLQQAFGQAQNLFQNWTPQYYPQSTVAPINNEETQGLNNVNNAAQWLTQNTNTDPLGSSMSFINSLLGGGFAYSNPAMSTLSNMSNTNIGTNNPGNQHARKPRWGKSERIPASAERTDCAGDEQRRL